jgi:hypothetical protein
MFITKNNCFAFSSIGHDWRIAIVEIFENESYLCDLHVDYQSPQRISHQNLFNDCDLQ